jgi:hypothetical protein
MPVTRDLSENKRKTILKWLDNPIIDIKHTVAEVKGISKSIVGSDALEVTNLTVEQQKFKDATKAKNGTVKSFPVLTNLFEF